MRAGLSRCPGGREINRSDAQGVGALDQRGLSELECSLGAALGHSILSDVWYYSGWLIGVNDGSRDARRAAVRRAVEQARGAS